MSRGRIGLQHNEARASFKVAAKRNKKCKEEGMIKKNSFFLFFGFQNYVN